MKKLMIVLLVFFTALPALAAPEKQSAYDRVMAAETIRCGYGTWAPWIYQDLKTGQLQGLNVEIMKAVGADTADDPRRGACSRPRARRRHL